MTDQLELTFSGSAEHRAPATIHLFPLHRQTALVERMALALDRKKPKDGERYWKTELNRQAAHMAVLGFSKQEQEEQIKRFAIAVQLVPRACAKTNP